MANITINFTPAVEARIIAWAKKELGDADATLDTVKENLVQDLILRIYKFEKRNRERVIAEDELRLRPVIT